MIVRLRGQILLNIDDGLDCYSMELCATCSTCRIPTNLLKFLQIERKFGGEGGNREIVETSPNDTIESLK